jgi:excisionase family DNA binding protein
MLSVEEVSGRLAVSEHAVRRAIARGDLPAFKVCRRVRIREEDLDAFIEAGRVGGDRVASRRRSAPRHEARPAGGLSALARRAA